MYYEDVNHDTREGARNLLGLINLKWICLLEYWNDILTHIDHVNILLQTKSQTIDMANKMINGLIEPMEYIRIDGFNKSLNRAENVAESLNIPFVLDEKWNRKIARKESFLKNISDEKPNTEENNLRIICLQSLDSILSSSRWRFKNMSIYIVLDFNFLTWNSLKTMASDTLKRCVDHLTL